MSVFLLVLGLILFVALVVVHEFGHFIMARRGGVEVEEFGIGFPPRAKVLTVKNGTEYTLNWLPLGGFVKLKGENDSDKSPGSFGAAQLSTKIKIMLAGVAMNLLAAFVLLTFLALIGMPQLIENQFTVASDSKITRQDVLVGGVLKDSPAEKSGIQIRDQILSISSSGDAKVINSAKQLPDITKQFQGQNIELTLKRNGDIKKLIMTLKSNKEVEDSQKTNHPQGYMGILPTEFLIRKSTWSAPVVAVGFMKQATELTFKGLGTAIGSLLKGDTTKASSQVSGPVGIFVLLKDGSALGYQFILMIIAIISLTLAIMNVLPIPALDGGRLFVTLLFRAIRKPLKENTENLIHGTGFAALMILFVLITFVDVKRFF